MGPNNNSLPLYKSRSLGYDKDTVKIHSNPYGRRASIYLQILARYIRTIIQDPKTRKVFVFLCLNLSFTGVEAVYGILTNSLSLTSDALHMFFDSSAIILGLFATVVAKWDADEKFTYGYVLFVVFRFFFFDIDPFNLYYNPQVRACRDFGWICERICIVLSKFRDHLGSY